MLYKSLHQKNFFLSKISISWIHFLLLALWEWNMFWRSYGIIQVYILFWSISMTSIWYSSAWPLICCDLRLLFRLIGGCCELFTGKHGNYGGISFLAHDVWNLVPPFFLYIFLMRDLVPWCMESRSIIFLYIFPYIIFPLWPFQIPFFHISLFHYGHFRYHFFIYHFSIMAISDTIFSYIIF